MGRTREIEVNASPLRYADARAWRSALALLMTEDHPASSSTWSASGDISALGVLSKREAVAAGWPNADIINRGSGGSARRRTWRRAAGVPRPGAARPPVVLLHDVGSPRRGPRRASTSRPRSLFPFASPRRRGARVGAGEYRPLSRSLDATFRARGASSRAPNLGGPSRG
jgi:hypothetical protein